MLSTRAGMRSPALTTASGKAFLAFCDDHAVVDRISAPLDRRCRRPVQKRTEPGARIRDRDGSGHRLSRHPRIGQSRHVAGRRRDRRALDRRARRLDGPRPCRPSRPVGGCRPLPPAGRGLDVMRTAVWTDSVSVLDRVTAVLEAFGGDEGLGVSEIARRANLPKSTVSRIVTDLVRQRYLDREGSRLHLGLRLFELGQAVERPRRLRRLAQPVIIRLRDMTGESVRLAVLDGDDVVLIAAVAGTDDLRHPATVGVRFQRPQHARSERRSWRTSRPRAGRLLPRRSTGARRDPANRGRIGQRRINRCGLRRERDPRARAHRRSGRSPSPDRRRRSTPGGWAALVRTAAATLSRRFGQSQLP